MKNILKEDRNKEIVKLRDLGVSCQEIADKFNISKQRVNEVYYKEINRGLLKRPRKTKWSSFYPLFVKEYAEGASIHQIADKYKCSSRTVFMAIKRSEATEN